MAGRPPAEAAAGRLPAGVASPAVCGLVAGWRARAAELRRYGAAPAAVTLEAAADELGAALQAEASEILTLAQAADASGYSRDQLRRLVRAGKLPDFGRPHAPRFRRADLPLKPGALISSPPTGMIDSARRQTVRASLAATGSD